MKRPLLLHSSAILCALCVGPSAHGEVATFGTGANQFTMEFVTIGNPGNAADTTGSLNPAGAVSFVYNMGNFEVIKQRFNSRKGHMNGFAGSAVRGEPDAYGKGPTLSDFAKEGARCSGNVFPQEFARRTIGLAGQSAKMSPLVD